MSIKKARKTLQNKEKFNYDILDKVANSGGTEVCVAAKYRKMKKAGASAYANAPVLHQKADKLPVDPAAWVVHHLFNL